MTHEPTGRVWSGVMESDIDPVVMHGMDPNYVWGSPDTPEAAGSEPELTPEELEERNLRPHEGGPI